MKVESFINILKSEFYTGVPDSQLKALCNYLMDKYGINKNHIIAANEGNAVGLAAGYYIATGKVPVVYMQNSGLGNIINPVASLMNEKVYSIPCIFVVGWRGEPGVHDEPQHVFQGEITLETLDLMNISYFVITKETKDEEVEKAMAKFNDLLSLGKQVAFVVKRGAISFDKKVKYQNENSMSREEAVKHITNVSKDDIIVSTTGKVSRELFEIREAKGQGHERDFLTVGSMGHSSSIALGIALNKPDKKIWIIDGDGASLMHLGSMAVLGANNPKNVIHVIINNEAHETVGGMPTVSGKIKITEIAKACGYKNIRSVDNFEDLDKALKEFKDINELCIIEVKCALGAREDLGRPTTTPKENIDNFMKYLHSEK